VAASTWQAVRATRAEQVALANAERARVAAEAERKAKEAEAAQRNEAEAVSKFLVSAFESPDPVRDGRTITVAEVLQRAEKQVSTELADQPLTQAALLRAVGNSQTGLGLYQEAIQTLSKAIELLQKNAGQDDPRTLVSLSDLAAVYVRERQRGEKKAIPLVEKAAAAQREILGADHPDTLRSLNVLGNAYHLAGRTNEAVALHEKVLAGRRKVLGANHRDTLGSMNNLANAYSQAGRTADATAMYERVVELTGEKFGPDHPDTLMYTSNLATVYAEAGRTNEVIALYERVVVQERKKLGEEHPSTRISVRNLAGEYSRAGRTAEAISLYEQILPIWHTKLGSNSPDTLWLMVTLAKSYIDAGRMDEGATLYETAIPILEKVTAAPREKLGLEEFVVVRKVNLLADTYAATGRTKDAILLLCRCGFYQGALWVAAPQADLELMTLLIDKAITEDVELLQYRYDRLVVGELRLLAGHFEAAETAIRASIALGETEGAMHKSLGLALLYQDRAEEAREAFRKALTRSFSARGW
jgi:tetratricopeptide (TPR) repeat protein